MVNQGKKSNLLSLVLIQHHQSEKAIFVSEDGDKDKAVWLPLSRIDIHDKSLQDGDDLLIEAEVPEWLALEKGLI